MNLRANWIWRSGMVVLTKVPAMPLAAPVPSKMSLLPSPTCGGAKLAWFMMLKISIRNWTLKFSEIRFTRLFLNTEKSRFVIPGPIKMLRPALPRMLKHARGESHGMGGTGGVALGSPRIGAPRLGGAGSQFAVQNASFGAVGTPNHSVFISMSALPGF